MGQCETRFTVKSTLQICCTSTGMHIPDVTMSGQLPRRLEVYGWLTDPDTMVQSVIQEARHNRQNIHHPTSC